MKKKLLFVLLLSFNLSPLVYGQYTKHLLTLRANAVQGIDVGDLDGDGDLDVLSVSSEDNKLAWYPNEGNGVFDFQIIIPTSLTQPRLLHTNDFDKDGDLDVLASGYEANKLVWHLNDGSGTFIEEIVISENFATPSKILSVDMEGDGDLDIVVVGDGIFWHNQNGPGNFVRHQVSGSGGATDIALADFDKDGDMDVISMDLTTDKLILHRSMNANVFQPEELASIGFFLGKLSVADLNGDGWEDIAYSDLVNNKVAWLANQGDGSFGDEQIISTSISWAKYISTADLNGDGHIDVFANSESNNDTHYFLNEGNGTFSTHDPIPTNSFIPSGLLAADLNQDQILDILWSSSSSSIIAWNAGNSNESFGNQNIITTETSYPGILHAFDVDKDGDLDVLNSKPLSWHENKGNKQFATLKPIFDSSADDLVIADLDGNGYDDLVTTHYQTLSWFPGNSQGFESERIIVSGLYGVKHLDVADLDKDGDLDIVTVNEDESDIVWFPNEGLAIFGEPRLIVEDFRLVGALKVADLNQDGTMDFIAGTTFIEDKIEWFSNNGEGVFESQGIIADDIQSINHDFVFDMDADGDLDVVFKGGPGDDILIAKNDGMGNWLPPIVVYEDNSFPSTQIIGLTDANGDGLPDILYNTTSNPALHVLIQTEVDVFDTPIKVGDTPSGHTQSVDLDLDGDLDILSPGEGLIWYENEMEQDIYPITGFTYFDVNENGLRDASEPALVNFPVRLSPDENLTFSRSNGSFTYMVSSGEYSLQSESNGIWQLTTANESYDINLSDEDEAANPYLFGFTPQRHRTEVRPFLSGQPTRCNSEVTYWLDYVNRGTTIAKGTVSLEVDELMTFASSEPEPDLIENGKWIWNFDELYPTQSSRIKIRFLTPDESHIGAILDAKAELYLILNDLPVPYAITDEYSSELLCSFDPNDKLARSNLLGQSEFAYIQDTILYTVRFQNTGNDTAFNVRIEDILDKKLDWTTFHPITASHEYRTELNRETGLATFYFDDIMLPDSTTNEQESHGFVMFGIASLLDLQDKIEVDNTASIFFDFNPPIITNTATLTLIEQVETNIETLNADYSIRVFPNPFSDYTTIEVNGLSAKGDYQLEVRDILGRKVRELKVENGKVRLDRGDLASGLYLIRIIGEEENRRILGSEKILIK